MPNNDVLQELLEKAVNLLIEQFQKSPAPNLPEIVAIKRINPEGTKWHIFVVRIGIDGFLASTTFEVNTDNDTIKVYN